MERETEYEAFEYSDARIIRGTPHKKERRDFVLSGVKATLETKSWCEFYKIYFNFTYHLGIAPFRFRKVNGKFEIYWTRIQTALCIIFQCSSLLYIRTTFIAGYDWVQAGEDNLSYFDLMFLVLLYGFDISTKSALWARQGAFASIYKSLEDSPLLTIRSSWTPRMAKFLVSLICTTYLVPSVFYIALVLGVTPSDIDGLLAGIDSRTASIFNLPAGWENLGFFTTTLKILAVFITIYTSAFWHYSDVLVLVTTLFFHRLSTDFFTALKNGDIPDDEVLHYFEAYQKVNKNVNKAAGLLVSVFLTYPLSYYATHLVDMLNDSEPMNRFSMCIYLGNLSVSLILGAKINEMANCIKEWMGKKHQKLGISTQKMKVILYDLKNEQIGINGGFCISMSFAGEVVNLLLTLAVVAIQFKM